VIGAVLLFISDSPFHVIAGSGQNPGIQFRDCSLWLRLGLLTILFIVCR